MTVARRLCLAALLALAPGAAAAQSTVAEWDAYAAREIAEGRLRTERTAPDAPFTAADLIRNFREIMLYSEYVLDGGVYVPGRAARALEKRTQPVRIGIEGAGVSRRDLAQINDAAARLARATGLRVQRDDADPNIRIAVLSADEMRGMADTLDAAGESATAAELRGGLGDAICAAYSFEPPRRGDDAPYLIVIPAELTGILRQSCIEEELGQAFGPNADYDRARPSVFNDDEEFALLTEHDELLLRMLYDPRLKAGMTEPQVMRLLPAILADLGRPTGPLPATVTKRNVK